jgi:hypothetical protein
MSAPDDDEGLDLEKGDYVEMKGTGEMGRVVGPGSKPGFWRVRFDQSGEQEVAEERLEPVY